MNTQTDMQQIARDMVGIEVYANVGTMVEYILQKSAEDSNAPFSRDELNLYPNPSEWDADRLNEYLNDELGVSWAEATGTHGEYTGEPTDDEMGLARDYIRDNAEPVEVFEWWAVSPWLRYKLEEQGEIIILAGGGLYVWGRCMMGQAIYMDYVIQKIAEQRK